MSPAPQGNLEVERYIGSCLISQRIPPNVKASPGNKRYQNHHVKPKHVDPDSEKIRNFNKFCFPQRDHHVGGPARYPLSPGQLPMSLECQGYGNTHYSKHSAGGSGWAGVPLISMTSGNHRRNKKVPSSSNPNEVHKYNQKQNSYKELDERSRHDSDRSPLTRLAIHTQGAPLIQADRYSGNNRCRNNYNRDLTPRVLRGEAGRWDSTKDTKTSVVNQNKDHQSCGNVDSLSVASDESSGNSENSLPRIIKPRKRRKKDRKPITGTNSALPSIASDSSQSSRQSDQNEETLKLKTFLPLCFEHNAPISRETISDPKSENNHIAEEKPNEDLIDPLSSADEFPFGNLLDDEDDNRSELSSCAPATVCQCRYCDPSGVIWDVDQRCYSPFLTPPSPTVHLSNSLPLAFDSFSQVSKSYNGRVVIIEAPQLSHPHYSFPGDLGTLLRRSWSEPSSYSKSEYSQTPNSEITGRDKSENIPPSPVGLQVSSEIVTSPNGHRDIEIKFYSSSTPPDSSKLKTSASDREQSDRCFVVEE